MLRTILTFGAIAGLIVAAPMYPLFLAASAHPDVQAFGPLAGYTLMFVALSMVFVGIKSYRDRARGGVIKFLPAFLVGLGISAVAGALYVVGWEITLAATHFNFVDAYSASVIDEARARGASGPELERMSADMEAFKVQYANPLFRLPITFSEIFPIGVVISVISALLLRNSRFLPARARTT